MSDPIANQIAAKRRELESLLSQQAERLPAVRAFLETAKKVPGVRTKDLELMLKQAEAVLGAANIKIPESKTE